MTHAVHVTEPSTYDFLGVEMTVLLSGEQTGGAFCLIEMRVPPDTIGGFHSHVFEDESLHVTAGELEVTIGEGPAFSLLAGESSFAKRNVPHRVCNRSAKVARAYFIHTPGSFADFVRTVAVRTRDRDIGGTGEPRPSDETQAVIARVVALAERFHIELIAPPATWQAADE